MSDQKAPRQTPLRTPHEPNQYPNIKVLELEDSWCGDPRDMRDEDLFFFGLDKSEDGSEKGC